MASNPQLLTTDGPFVPIRPTSIDKGKIRAEAAAPGDDWETLTPEELENQLAVEQFAKIQNFAATIMARRDEAIKARAASGVESRWMADSDAYLGRDASARQDENWDILTQGAQPHGPEKKARRRSRVFVQITRQKTNTAAARVQDLLFPSDERNWQMKPTPRPQLAKLLENNANTVVKDEKPGSPTFGQELPHPTENRSLTAGDLVEEELATARQKCAAMQTEIDDQHVECQYNDMGRRAIEDAARLGTGILKGPVVVNRVKKVWQKGPQGWAMEIVEDLRPASFHVDPWNFYPAAGCGDDIQKGGYCFEREPVSPSTLRSLARVKSYNQAAILQCLDEGPAPDNIFLGKRSQAYVDAGAFQRTHFDLWNYYGDVEREELAALGVDVTRALTQRITAQVVMCNGRVIKAILNPMDTGDLPYDVMTWDSIDDGPWGVGIPYIMRYAQRSLNAAWRQMQDNAGVAHGPQIVMNRRLIEPADKDWNITGMKLWHTRGDASVEDVNKAFTVFQISSNQQQLEAIIQLCLKFIDDETAIPMMAQGEKGTAPDKVGIVSMMMNASNVVLKRIARNWDMRVTNPHIRRYFDWNMQYSEKDEIKGDFAVHALGSTALVVRDQQKQDIANLMAMSTDPQYREFVNPQKVMAVAWKMSSVPDVLYTDTELKERAAAKAKEQPQENPQITVARIRAEAAIKAEQTEAESERVNQELRMEEAKRNDEREIYKMELERDLKILEHAAKMDMTVAQIKGMLAGKVMDIQAQHRDTETKAAVQAMGKGEFKSPSRKPRVRPPKSKAPAQLVTRMQ